MGEVVVGQVERAELVVSQDASKGVDGVVVDEVVAEVQVDQKFLGLGEDGGRGVTFWENWVRNIRLFWPSFMPLRSSLKSIFPESKVND